MESPTPSTIIRLETFDAKHELRIFLYFIELVAIMETAFCHHINDWEHLDIDIVQVPEGIAEIILEEETPLGETLYTELKLNANSYLQVHGKKGVPWSWPGDYLMVWGYTPQFPTLFYWTTKLETVRRGDKPYDPSKTSKFGRTGISNSQIGRRSRTSSESN